MKECTWRRSSIVLGLLVASCGGHDSSVAPLPAAPSAPSSGANGGGYAMASSQGLAPEGFELKMKLDPKPGEDGIIRDGGPVTVDVDLCGSTADAGKTLHFLFDWDFNDLADVSGTGDVCVQKHTFHVPKDATKDVVLEANVCVTNGDPGVHDGSTYFSCRVVRVALPKPAASGGTCEPGAGLPPGCHNTGGLFAMLWPGGTGPEEDVPGFNDPGCQDFSTFSPAPVVVACSASEAQALCESEIVAPFGQFENGAIGYLCDFDVDTVSRQTWGARKR